MARTPRIALDTDTAHTLDGRQLRSLTFQSVRMEYVARTLEATGPHPEGARALTVGAGRGLVSRGLARMGWAVTAVDPSSEATRLARRAAEDEGLALSHHTAPAEALPVGDGGTLVPCEAAHVPTTFSGFGMVTVVTLDMERDLGEALAGEPATGVGELRYRLAPSRLPSPALSREPDDGGGRGGHRRRGAGRARGRDRRASAGNG
jgi:SAM-dependent methyltransferase